MTNPILAEIQGLSPEAKGALGMAGHAIAASSQPATPAPGMLLPHPDSPPAPVSMPAPSLSLPPAQMDSVKAPMGTVTGDTNARGTLLGEKPGVENIAHDVEGSRIGQAHPFLGKLLGGVAEGAGMVGDTLLHAAAPGLERTIPGTEGNYARNLGRADTALTQDEGNAEKEAQTGDYNAEIAEHAANAEAKLNPPEKPPSVEKWKPLLGGSGEVVTAPNGNIVEVNDAGELRAQNLPTGATVAPKPTSPGHSAFDDWSAHPDQYAAFEKSMADIKAQVAAEHPHQAANASFMNIYAAQKFLNMAYTQNPKLLPVASQMIGKMLNLSPEQTAAMGQVPTDQPLSPFTTEPIGTHMPSAPTANTRTSAQNAAKFLTEYPRITADVNSATNNLGPVKGREVMGFLLGQVGSTGDPAADEKLSKLRTDLTFVGSNAAKFHVNSVRQAELFDKLAASGKNTAPAIQGFLDSVKSWAQTSEHQERGFGETGNSGKSEAPKAGDVEGGYRFKGGDPAKQSNWEQVK